MGTNDTKGFGHETIDLIVSIMSVMGIPVSIISFLITSIIYCSLPQLRNSLQPSAIIQASV